MKTRVFRLLFFSILFSTSAFSADEIITWGYGQQMHDILVAVSALTGNSNDPIIKIAASIGALVIMIRMTVGGKADFVDFLKFVVMTTIITQLFWASKGEYIVRDKTNNFVSPIVLQIPQGIGMTFSLMTRLEDGLAKGFEENFSTPNSITFRNAGLGFMMSAHLGLSTDTILTDATLMRTFTEYMDNCYWNDVLVNNRDVNDDKNSPNLATALVVDAAFLTPIYEKGSPSQLMSCVDAWANINGRLPADINKQMEVLAKGYSMSGATYFGKMGDVAQTLFKNAGLSSQQYITQMALMNAFNSSTQAVAMATGGSASNIAVGQAVTQASTKAGWAQAGIQAKSTLPLQKAFLTIISVVLLLLMSLYSIATADYRGIIEVIKLLFTFMMWTPLVIVINYMMYSKLEDIFSGYTSLDLPSIMNGQLLSNEASSYLAFLSYAVTLVTGMSFMLVSRSVTAFVQTANAGVAMGVTQGTAAGGMGAISMNNLSVANSNIRNDVAGSRSREGARLDESHLGGVDPVQGGHGQMNQTDNSGVHTRRMDNNTVEATFKGSQAIDASIKGVNFAKSSESFGERVDQTKQSLESYSQSLNTQKAASLGRELSDRTSSSEIERTAKEHGLSSDESQAVRQQFEESSRKAYDQAFDTMEKSGNVKSVNGRAYMDAHVGADAKFAGGKAGISGEKSLSAFLNSEASKSEKAAFEQAYRENLSKEIDHRMSTNDAFRHSIEKSHNHDISHGRTASNSESYQISEAWQKTQNEISSLSSFKNLSGEHGRDLNTAVANRLADAFGARTEDQKLQLWEDIREHEVVLNDSKYKGAIDNAMTVELEKRGIVGGGAADRIKAEVLQNHGQIAEGKAGIESKINEIQVRSETLSATKNIGLLDENKERAALENNFNNKTKDLSPSATKTEQQQNQVQQSFLNTKAAANETIKSNPLAMAGKSALETGRDLVTPTKGYQGRNIDMTAVKRAKDDSKGKM